MNNTDRWFLMTAFYVSQHATGKRCQSVDDITPAAEEELQNGRIGKNGYSSANFSPLSRKHSQSTGDMLEDERCLFTVHRTVEIGESGHPEVRIRHSATKLLDNNNDDEPEFIKVGRRLRHNSPYLEKLGYHHENVHDVPQDVPAIPKNDPQKGDL
ncbi:unnamed protein product [Angiostrongylus costaricensis]|uniref:Uncharacterized protein n=1 Tax=Angiostrongylus costaricensis TaxID=334426 RepID=A0A0R3PES9_ANGCS|nr:unnamed protein product [Angiostrongylus costaricensis]